MTFLKVMAVDDEELALRRVVLLMNGIDDAELVATTQDPLDALAQIDRLRPDVLLLDIHMAGLGGIELAEHLLQTGGHFPQIIFVTAFNQHAVRAFEARAVDYVLKPLRADRLRIALDHARRQIAQERASQRAAHLERVVHELRRQLVPAPTDSDDQEIWAQRGDNYVRLLSRDIIWAESERDYVHLHNRERAFLLRTTMTALSDRLGSEHFIRVRRSALVRLDHIEAIRDRGYGNVHVLLRTGTEVRVGRTYLKPLRDRMSPREAG
jgi:DNA-binding LytR/AlgR family response regulator